MPGNVSRYGYRKDVYALWMPATASVDAAEAKRIEQLLTRLPELSSLSIKGVRPGAGRLLQPLAGRWLRQLELAGPGITDETLVDIAALPGLAYLNVSHSSVTDDGLAELAKLRGLETIDLSHTRISGEGLSKLASLPRLWGIDLSGVPMDDSDLSTLEQYPALTMVNLRGTRTTDEGIEQFRAALPRPIVLNQAFDFGPLMLGVGPAVPAQPAAAPTAVAPQTSAPDSVESPVEPLSNEDAARPQSKH